MSIGTITSTLDILNSVSRDKRNIGELSEKVQGALNNTNRGQKYSSRAELDATGLSTIFDNAHATILKAEANKITLQSTDIKLQAQKQALTDINAVMVEFEKPKDASAAGTKAERADKALAEIGRIMRSKNGSGEYIFGGNDPFTDPLSFINQAGNRVPVDLKTQSNVVNGKIMVNNYSNASANVNVVTASSAHEVKQSFLYAGMDSMVKTIGYLNMVKTGEVTAAPGVAAITLQDIAAAQRAQEDARGEIKLLVDTEIEKLKAAKAVNASDITTASGTLQEFKGDLVQLATTAADLIRSFIAAVSIDNASNRAFDRILENSRI